LREFLRLSCEPFFSVAIAPDLLVRWSRMFRLLAMASERLRAHSFFIEERFACLFYPMTDVSRANASTPTRSRWHRAFQFRDLILRAAPILPPSAKRRPALRVEALLGREGLEGERWRLGRGWYERPERDAAIV